MEAAIFITIFFLAIAITTAILEKKKLPQPRGEDTSHSEHVRVTPMPKFSVSK